MPLGVWAPPSVPPHRAPWESDLRCPHGLRCTAELVRGAAAACCYRGLPWALDRKEEVELERAPVFTGEIRGLSLHCAAAKGDI